MKKTNLTRSKPCRPIGFLLLLFFFSAGSLFAQSSVKKNSSTKFGTFNNVSNYSEDMTAFAQILNTSDATQLVDAKTKMKQYYQEMSNIGINDAMLEAMLDATQANYDVWMAVYLDIKENHSAEDLYVLRSIIMNIKKGM